MTTPRWAPPGVFANGSDTAAIGHGHSHTHQPPTFGGREPRSGRAMDSRGIFRIGVAGPVGSGKTATLLALCNELRDTLNLAVVTNDIYTDEDAQFLKRHSALPDDRIVGVATGGCPHSAIREDATLNLQAIDVLAQRHQGLELILMESGGDNLAATFSPELVDRVIYVIDVAGGDKIPRKGGPGVCDSDLLVINKKDLAPYVGADLDVMRRDADGQRRGPFLFTDMRAPDDKRAVAGWVLHEVMAAAEA